MADIKTKNGYSAAVTAAIEKHGRQHDALIPILLELNKTLGYVPGEALAEVRKQLHAPKDGIYVQQSQLFGLASFYHMLSTRPRVRHLVLFCESAPCHVMGGRQVWQALQENLQLKSGQTSPDGKWSLVTTSCLGVCGIGPVVVIDEDMFGNVTPEQLPEILGRYE
ncbi:MAG: NAD(P)H-dependent oxidoreductase subunit E [Chloroflexota bacterium]